MFERRNCCSTAGTEVEVAGTTGVGEAVITEVVVVAAGTGTTGVVAAAAVAVVVAAGTGIMAAVAAAGGAAVMTAPPGMTIVEAPGMMLRPRPRMRPRLPTHRRLLTLNRYTSALHRQWNLMPEGIAL